MLYNGCLHKCKVWRKYFVVAGGILIYLPIGVPWYFGNLATYLNSYFHARAPSESDLVDPQWVFSAFFIAFSLAITLSGYVSNKWGPRATIIAAIVIHSGATFLSYFAIQHSMLALILVFGAMGGLGAGLAYGPPLPVVIKWLPRRMGVASGALMMGFGGGAVFYNELITYVINPTNQKPDIKGERTTYFSQPSLLRNIPEVFIVLGVLTIILQTLGVLMLRLPKPDDDVDEVSMQEVTPIVHRMNGEQQQQQPQEQQQQQQQQQQKQEGPEGQTTSAKDVESGVGTNGHTPVANGTAVAEEGATKDRSETEKTPMELLKCPDFYILWIALAFNHYGYIIKNNYYKEFGQLRIDNDHFLTKTGTIATIAVSLARLLWGLATDWLGSKLTMLVFTSMTVVTTSFWYFSLFGGQWLYMAWVVIVSGTFTGAFILFPLAALKWFGEENYASNYGLILSSQIVVNLISPPIIRAILVYLGWFWIFFSIAFVNLLGKT
ncbi:oxalate:formate antiporter-like isoform x1 [Plakobranchus ocellatus]|uniref:Oxalate:formate antiporter-like isoform x1 n=1 Tax=Plakobranchus ocellatus TaxID=259542 RepID=A0AAV3Z9F8_9GAST|nr:oxalate:formate antiporter-like isoform x1 [Plakobranchus ocellatus]